MATKMASNPTTLQELQRREVKKPLSGRARPTAIKATTTKSSASSMNDKGTAAAKMKKDRMKKLKEEQEEERKKKLEEKQAKERERLIMAEKRKAMEVKRKETARLATMKDKVASSSSSTKTASKPSVKEVAPVSKSATLRSVHATDGAKTLSGNKTTLSSASSGALATKKTGISNGSATVPSRISKPVASNTSRLVSPTAAASTKPSLSKMVLAPSRPGGTKVTSSNPQGIKATFRVAPPSSRPQSTRTSGAATTGTTNKIASSKQARLPAPSSTCLGVTSDPSKSATQVKSNSPAAGRTKVAKPESSVISSSTATSPGKAATALRNNLRAASVAKTTGSGRGAAPSFGVKKSLEVNKASSKIPKTLSKTGTRTTSTKATSLSSPKVATKVVSKTSPKVSGGKLTSTTGKRPDVKKTTKLSAKKEEPVKDVVTSKSKTGTDDVMEVIETEISVLPDRNGVDELPVTSVPADTDMMLPCPPEVDSSPLSDTPISFTQATAQRAGQIISLQTSLSKELQSKLPRLGDVLDSVEGNVGDENIALRENERNGDNRLKSVDGDNQLDDDAGLYGPRDIQLSTNHVEVVVELMVDEEGKKTEEEREERRKRVDVIMERTKIQGHETGLVAEEEMEQNLDEDSKPSNASFLPIILDLSGDLEEHASVGGEVAYERGTVSTQDSFEFRLVHEQPEPLEVSVEVVVEESGGNEEDEACDEEDIVESNVKSDGKADDEPESETFSHTPNSLAHFEAVPTSTQEGEAAESNYQQGSLAEVEAAQDDQNQINGIIVQEKEYTSPEHEMVSSPYSPTADVAEQEERHEVVKEEGVYDKVEGEEKEDEELEEVDMAEQEERQQEVVKEEDICDKIEVEEKKDEELEEADVAELEERQEVVKEEGTCDKIEGEGKEDEELEEADVAKQEERRQEVVKEDGICDKIEGEGKEDEELVEADVAKQEEERQEVVKEEGIRDQLEGEGKEDEVVDEAKEDEEEHENGTADEEEEKEENYSKDNFSGHISPEINMSPPMLMEEEREMEEEIESGLEDKGEAEEAVMVEENLLIEASLEVHEALQVQDLITGAEELITEAEEDLAVGDGLHSLRSSGDIEVMAQPGPILAGDSASFDDDEETEVKNDEEDDIESESKVKEVEDEGIAEVENEEEKDGEVEIEMDAGPSREEYSQLSFEDDKASSDILVPQMLKPVFTEEDLTVGDRLDPFGPNGDREDLTVGGRLDTSGPNGDSEFPSQAEALADAASAESSSHISNDLLSGHSVESPLLDISDSNELPRSEDQDGEGMANFASVPQDIFASPFTSSPLTFDPFGFDSVPKEENAAFPVASAREDCTETFERDDSSNLVVQQPPLLPGTLADNNTSDNTISFEEDI